MDGKCFGQSCDIFEFVKHYVGTPAVMDEEVVICYDTLKY